MRLQAQVRQQAWLRQGQQEQLAAVTAQVTAQRAWLWQAGPSG
jgi:hypothetical protein